MKQQMLGLIKNKVFMAVAGIIFGVILLMKRSEALDALVKISGWILLVTAAVYIIRYFASRENKNPLHIVTGILCALLGILFVAEPAAIVDFFPMIMGVLLVVSGVTDLIQAFGSMKVNASRATVFLVFAILIIILGVVIVLRPAAVADTIVALVGFSLIVNGITDLIMLAALTKD